MSALAVEIGLALAAVDFVVMHMKGCVQVRIWAASMAHTAGPGT